MCGNSIEEGLFLQIKNPSHNDPSRFGFLAGAPVFIVLLVAMIEFAPVIPPVLQIFLSMAVALPTVIWVTSLISSGRLAKEVKFLEEQRQARHIETERAISLAQASV